MNNTLKQDNYVNQIIFLLLSFTLWVDALTGMVQFYGLSHFKLSLFYKLPLVFCMLYIIGRYSVKALTFIFICWLLLLVGPSHYFLSSPKVSFYISDFGYTVKILTPFITFYYCKVISEVTPELLGKYGERALWINFSAIVFNLFIGVLGFGYPSYASGGVDGEGIGVNGFYTAGNELGGCFILLFGFVLHFAWNYWARKTFIFIAVMTFICGALIATKSALIASALLIFAVPLFNERKAFFKLTKLKIRVFIPLILLAVITTIFIIEFLQTIGLYNKMIWILNERGIWHLILSGRLEYTQAIWDIYMSISGWFEYLFGIGSIGVSDFFHTKYSAEVYPVDLFTYFGLVGLFIAYSLIITMTVTATSIFQEDFFIPPFIVLVNLLLLMLSTLSGHIMMSGMLGPLWGLLNGLIFIKALPRKQNCE